MANLDKIYVEANLDNNDLWVSSESLLALFSLQFCQDLDLSLVFTSQIEIDDRNNKCIFPIKVDAFSYSYEYIEREKCPKLITNCLLPAVMVESDTWVVVGLSASVRHFLAMKAEADPNHISNVLLGFRKGCLQACAEVSIWTKFCEIELIDLLQTLYSMKTVTESLTIPKNILRYECHLKRPPILHNALKKKQEVFGKGIQDKEEKLKFKKQQLKDLPDLDHKYAEGTDFTLADIFIYTSISLCIFRLKNVPDLMNICPLIHKWKLNLENMEYITDANKIFNEIVLYYSPLSISPGTLISYPEISNESLYKNDPDRYKPRWRSFTHQNDIAEVTRKIKRIFTVNKTDLVLNDKITNKWISSNFDEDILANLSLIGEKIFYKKKLMAYTLCFEKPLAWESYPKGVNPSDGELPLNRLKRKCDQLESMAQVVLRIAEDGNKIVDFCSGGGHLGILLAYCLPKCTILLVENKKASLIKAYKRVKTLKLTNVQFYQCNLDYFCDNFDIGICLHACGSATDLVMQKCISKQASFVCCPCCYGSLQPNHILSYPRSSFYETELEISLSDYLILGHAADQTHGEKNPKTEQGRECMLYVDFDRLAQAQACGYQTILGIMNPPQCTPKNHILLGVYGI